jgi:hypothetical protein
VTSTSSNIRLESWATALPQRAVEMAKDNVLSGIRGFFILTPE